jgi:streptogramin lyase
LWFIEAVPSPLGADGVPLTDRIGRITTTGAVTEYALPPFPVYLGVSSITAGSDGAMWFTEYYKGAIGRISMDAVVTEYSFASFGFPKAITAGPDGALWFTLSSDNDWINTIGRITTDGAFTQYSAPVQNINYSGAITTGPDGAVWFTDGWSLNPFIVRAVLGPGVTIAIRTRGHSTPPLYNAMAPRPKLPAPRKESGR